MTTRASLAVSYAGSSDVDSPFGGLTFPFTLTNIGDLVTVILFCSANFTCTGMTVSGTGTVVGAAFTNVFQTFSTGLGPYDIEIWSAIVTGTGSITVTTTMSGNVSSQNMSFSPREFTCTSPTHAQWLITDIATLNQAPGGGGTTIAGASITPPVANFAFMSYAGFEYDTDFILGYYMYNPTPGTGTVQPTFTQATTNAGYFGISALIQAVPAPQRALNPKQAVMRKASR
jgi:hypothetical protein